MQKEKILRTSREAVFEKKVNVPEKASFVLHLPGCQAARLSAMRYKVSQQGESPVNMGCFN